MQFRQIAALAGSALVGSLAAVAPAMAINVTKVSEITNLVTKDSFPVFVVGADAMPADIAGAIGIAANYASMSKETSNVALAGVGPSVSGGIALESPGDKFTPWQSMNALKPVITSTNLDLLKGGTYQLTSGTSGTYKEYMYMGDPAGGDATVKYDTPTGATTPSLYMDVPSGKILYSYLMSFPTPLTLGTTDATDKVSLEGSKMTMMGKEFIISEATVVGGAITGLTVLGGGQKVTVSTTESVDSTVGSTTYTVTLTGVAAENIGGVVYYKALGTIGGNSFSLRSGQTMTMTDGTNVGAISVMQGKSGAPDFAELVIGGSKLLLPQAGSVQKDGVIVTGLTSAITTAAHKMSSIQLTYTPNTAVAVPVGSSISDAFVGAFKILFGALTPALDDTTSRQSITYSASGPNMAVSYKNLDSETESFTPLFYNAGPVIWGKSATIGFAVDENTVINAVTGDYFVVASGGFSHVLQFTSMDPANNLMTFTDVGTGQAIQISFAIGGGVYDAQLISDGFAYNIEVNGVPSPTNKKIWVDMNRDGNIAGSADTDGSDTALTAATAGQDYAYLVPNLISAGQGGMYFSNGEYDAPALGSATYYPAVGVGYIQLVATVGAGGAASTVAVTGPQGAIGTLTVPDGAPGAVANLDFTINSVDFRLSCQENPATVLNCGNAADGGLGLYMWTGAAAGKIGEKGLVLVEESLEGGTVHNWIYVPAIYDATSNQLEAGVPSTDAVTGITGTVSGTTQTKKMTQYGTFFQYDTQSGSASLSYPDSFALATVAVGASPTVGTGGTGGTVTTDKVVAVTADIAMLDTEVTDSVKTGSDLFVMGGPGVNKLAAELLDKTYPAYGADSGIPQNAAIIKVFPDAFATGKTAVLIAGWEAADTDLAARVIQAKSDLLKTQAVAGVQVSGTIASPTITTLA